MNKVFKEEIGETLEVYMDDMIVKSSEYELHDPHLNRIFQRVWQYNMRLNLEECTFRVIDGKFLSFYLEERGIKANELIWGDHQNGNTNNKEIIDEVKWNVDISK